MDLLDTKQLDALAPGAPELLLDIIQDFQTQTQELLQQAQTLTPAQTPELLNILHQIKGSSGTIGLQELHHQTAQAESQIKESQTWNPTLIPTLQTLTKQSTTAATQHLNKPH